MRKATLIQTAIWSEPDFRGLSAHAKLAYFMLLTQPTVATTGLLPARVKWWAACLSTDAVNLLTTLAELEAAEFIWTDHITEEAVIRSWVKHNVIGNKNMVSAARDQLKAIDSDGLRGRLALEYPDVFTDPAPQAKPEGHPQGHPEAPSIPHPQAPSGGVPKSAVYEVRGTRYVAETQPYPVIEPTQGKRLDPVGRLCDAIGADERAEQTMKRDIGTRGLTEAHIHLIREQAVKRPRDKRIGFAISRIRKIGLDEVA